MPSLSRLSLLAACTLLTLCSVHTIPFPFPVSALSPDTWTPATGYRVGYNSDPVWRDEFDSDGLDTTKWYAHDGPWPDNGELQYYSPNPDYVSVADGKLGITARNVKTGGRDYTSGRIDTHLSAQFKHGLFAARIRFPKGQGIWPAWWMFGTGPKYSEFDIAEMAGGSSALTSPPSGSGNDASYGALCHFSIEDKPTHAVTRGPVKSFKPPTGQIFNDDFHVMWMEWTDTKVTMGLNDWPQLLLEDVSQLEAFEGHMFLILNVAIGGSYPGSPDASTPWPQTMEVDWVRVWAKDGEDIFMKPPPPQSSSTGTQQPDTEQPGNEGSTGLDGTPDPDGTDLDPVDVNDTGAASTLDASKILMIALIAALCCITRIL